MTDRHPVWQLLDKIQMDAKALDRKVDELRRLMLGFELKTELGFSPTCGECGIGAGLHAAGCSQAPDEPSPGELVGAVMRGDPPPWLEADRVAEARPEGASSTRSPEATP